ncbi:pyrimidine/purine nucleoside phosphorylase [Shewanella algidipiscicola]|uniref:Pyrimidine/purine nucleoside phosphorylase n=1 Tax=Shewanella algidipiscicola TaxID=614070 RepID=A0ABQ4PM98_9GAMM|nr:pyrimidine/purine nucleoside phosphorylase [Shewanella algidipiscicola]GIU49352.1 UPF0345 protein [Shewanella algidipiscicola]
MNQFQQVSVDKLANVYFDGKVMSRTVTFSDGSTQTLGVVLPGEYEFSTAVGEIMHVIDGTLSVLLPGSDTWQSFSAGSQFQLAAKVSFTMRANDIAQYCCQYLD